MFKKTFLFILSFLCASMLASAQGISVSKKLSADNGFFNHLDLSVSAGSTGIGIDVAMPVGEYAKVRAGFAYMPRFEKISSFRVQVGDSLDKKYDQQGNRIETKFDRLSGMLKSMTGYSVDDNVDMIMTPNYYNFRLLCDVYPFKNKRWHITAGFYLGNSTIGKSYNTTEEMPTLVSVTMYNMMFDRLHNGEPLFSFNETYTFDLPPETLYPLLDKLDEYGRMAFQVGYHKKDGPLLFDEYGNPELDDYGNQKRAYNAGDPYMMEPGEDGMVKAVARVNRFKPYLGFGYARPITKDGLTEFSFDAGVLFWGGKPHVYTHEDIDIMYDCENVTGQVGDYLSFMRAFPVFPVLEIRITRRIF